MALPLPTTPSDPEAYRLAPQRIKRCTFRRLIQVEIRRRPPLRRRLPAAGPSSSDPPGRPRFGRPDLQLLHRRPHLPPRRGLTPAGLESAIGPIAARTVQAKAAGEHESARTPRCVSERRSRPTPAWAVPAAIVEVLSARRSVRRVLSRDAVAPPGMAIHLRPPVTRRLLRPTRGLGSAPLPRRTGLRPPIWPCSR